MTDANTSTLIEAIRAWNGDSPDMLKEAAVDLVIEHSGGKPAVEQQPNEAPNIFAMADAMQAHFDKHQRFNAGEMAEVAYRALPKRESPTPQPKPQGSEAESLMDNK